QRSMVTSLTYTFDHAVTLGAGAFTIGLHPNVTVNGTAGQTVGTLPTLSWSSADGGLTWVVTFSGAGVVGGSIADRVYDGTLHHAAVTDAAGQAATSDRLDTVYRLFGDFNGDHTVNNADASKFATAFNKPSNYLAYFDANGDGSVNNFDASQF